MDTVNRTETKAGSVYADAVMSADTEAGARIFLDCARIVVNVKSMVWCLTLGSKIQY